jgi:hypothetical protein
MGTIPLAAGLPHFSSGPVRCRRKPNSGDTMSDGGATVPTAEQTLSREAISRIDSTGQLNDVLGLPEHLRDALWRVESAIMAEWDTPAGLVVAGMGGSAIGGALARAALSDHASRPIFITRAYGLPTWTTRELLR